MAFVNPQGTVFVRWHGAGIVFRRHTFEWVLPAMMGPHLKYDPRKLPVPVVAVDIGPEHVHIWEWTAEKRDYDTRVYAKGLDNETHLLRLATDRLHDGYRGGTTVPRVQEL